MLNLDNPSASRISTHAQNQVHWKCDSLRTKGGVTDYCVINEIDVQALREFQSSRLSPAKLFKPAPDGFEINFSRKCFRQENKNE